MPDRMGYRAKWGLIVPERNTVCESELHRAVPEGITINTARVSRNTPAAWTNDKEFRDMSQATLDGRPAALAQLAAAEVDHYIVGDAGFTISREAHVALAADYEKQTGKGVSTAALAYLAALERLGARRVAVITPRLPDSGVVSGGLWEECGYTVAGAYGLNRHSAFEIVGTTEDMLHTGMAEMGATDAEVVLVTGTNLYAMYLADAAERELGKPVLHINTVLLWHALRQCGFDDRIDGCGSLLREH
jgi:maleate isomerase